MTVLSRGDCEPAYCRRLTLVLVFPLPHSRIAGKLQQKDILRRPHPVYHCDGRRTPEPLCGSFLMCFWTTIEDCSIKAKCCLPAVHCQDNTFGQNKRHLGFHQGNTVEAGKTLQHPQALNMRLANCRACRARPGQAVSSGFLVSSIYEWIIFGGYCCI